VRFVRRRYAITALLGLLGLAIVATTVLTSSTSGDYNATGAVAGDNAGPAINALIHGHLGAMVSNQPLMGLTSILLRAPFVKVATVLGAGDFTVYAVGALVCLIPAALLAAWIVARPALSRGARVAGVLAAALIVAGPGTIDSIRLGHPEEVLATVLATMAVLAAMRGRCGLAAVLLGVAIGAKQWAVLAAIPVLLAVDDHRVATALKAAAIALLLTALLPLADPSAFSRADSIVGGLSFSDPFSIWWPLGSPLHAGVTAHSLPLGITRSVASAAACLAGLGALLAYGRRHGRRGRYDALALLSLVGLLRCIADPDPLQYNFVALLIPLATWEAVTLARLPVVSLLAVAAVALLGTGSVAMSAGTAFALGSGVVNVLSLAWTLGLGCYLGRHAVGASRDRAPKKRPLLGLKTAGAGGGV
jgi:hypothetical protein